MNLPELCAQAMELAAPDKLDLSRCVYGLHKRTGEMVGTPQYYQLLAGLILTTQTPEPQVLEVGTYRGGAAMAMATAGASVLTIDIVSKPGPAHPQLHRIIGDSCAPVTQALVSTQLSAPIDLLFIDSHHTAESVEQNLAAYLPFQPRLIVLDDIHLNPSMEALWSTIAKQMPFEAFDASVLVSRGCGFGVLRARK